METKLKKEEVYQYLNKLRESGVTNMFGAAPYVQRKFCIDIKEARQWLKDWMRDF